MITIDSFRLESEAPISARMDEFPGIESLEKMAEASGFSLLESTLSAYGRGKRTFIAREPISELTFSSNELLPRRWGEIFDDFVSDRSKFYVVLLSYEFGQELVLEQLPSGPRDGSTTPRIVVLAYDSVSRTEGGLASHPGIEEDQLFITHGKAKMMRAPCRDRYESRVRAIKSLIREGEIYQANLTDCWDIKSPKSPWEVYCELKKLNPSQYAAFVNLGETQIISSSPERLFETDGSRISANPIKGTISAGANAWERDRNLKALLASEKDKAELLMIVDLLRNDLGKICQTGSVVTQSIWSPESYSSVIHLAGSITGKLNSAVTPSQIIKAVFPGGSITGAPKCRAIRALSEIESVPRGIYTGSIGYIDGTRFELNIAIRTLVASNGIYRAYAGGGIVADSDPLAEYDEACLKARNLIRAIDPELNVCQK
ncbi:MAG: anthranilate synthase component I family protein [candidate division Zixibacteria bacterium]|nr:anthranilate synthase component I family protein [candidate division Zixibacteria bacterium]